MIKAFLEEEAHEIVFKFFLAMICLSVVVFSLFQLGFAFQLWVTQYKDSFQMSCVMFTSTLLSSLLGIYLLFNKRKEKITDISLVNREHPLIGMNLQEKGFTFIRGLIDGLLNGRGTH